MRVDYIAAAIPAFFLLIGIEIAVARAKRRAYYRFSDSIADLGCGVIQQVSAVFLRVAIVAGYEWLYRAHRLVDIAESSAWAWVALFFGVDFFYYWFHRLSHEINVMWAAHVVHHQSEEYNLAVALRQAVFQPLFSWIFSLPLAIAGFPPVMFAGMLAFTTLYQFWIHTRLIPKLGPFEWVFNTPSHHRVHHGRNPKYIDRNHGATLIIWDRLFGTFQEEDEEVIYGVTEPVASFNPLWANFHAYRDLVDDSRSANTILDAIKVWIMPPGWKPNSDRPPPSRSIALDAPKYDQTVPRTLQAYALGHFVLAVAGAVTLLGMREQGDWSLMIVLGTMVVLTCTSLGALLDRRAWAPGFELARIVAVLAVIGGGIRLGWISNEHALALAAFIAVSIAFVATRRREWAHA